MTAFTPASRLRLIPLCSSVQVSRHLLVTSYPTGSKKVNTFREIWRELLTRNKPPGYCVFHMFPARPSSVGRRPAAGCCSTRITPRGSGGWWRAGCCWGGPRRDPIPPPSGVHARDARPQGSDQIFTRRVFQIYLTVNTWSSYPIRIFCVNKGYLFLKFERVGYHLANAYPTESQKGTK
jgi:hypothetical protein